MENTIKLISDEELQARIAQAKSVKAKGENALKNSEDAAKLSLVAIEFAQKILDEYQEEVTRRESVKKELEEHTRAAFNGFGNPYVSMFDEYLKNPNRYLIGAHEPYLYRTAFIHPQSPHIVGKAIHDAMEKDLEDMMLNGDRYKFSENPKNNVKVGYTNPQTGEYEVLGEGYIPLSDLEKILSQHNLNVESTCDDLETEEVAVDYTKSVVVDGVETYPTGARRSASGGRLRYDLISPIFMERLAERLTNGAQEHEDRNWELGMPLSRYWESLQRHLQDYFMGYDSDDNLAGAAFNLMAIIHTEHEALYGNLPEELINIGPNK